MSDDPWIVIPSWDKFQHYGNRQPVWIKVYAELNSRDDWLDLSDAERGLLVVIWIEYARSRGHLKSARLPAGVRQKGRRRALDRLVHAGFIALSASKPLAQSKKKKKEMNKQVRRARVRAEGNGQPEALPIDEQLRRVRALSDQVTSYGGVRNA